MERVGQRVSVVRQDKGCALPYRASAGWRRFPYDFFARYRNVRASWRVAVRALLERASGATFKERTRRAVLTLGASVGAAAGLALAGHLLQLRVTLTDSAAPAGIYRLITAPAGRGALVAACLPAAIARTGLTRGYLQAGDCPGGVEPVAKVLGALPGDVVEVAPGGVAVNGVPFANSATAARQRGPAAHARGVGRPAGQGRRGLAVRFLQWAELGCALFRRGTAGRRAGRAAADREGVRS